MTLILIITTSLLLIITNSHLLIFSISALLIYILLNNTVIFSIKRIIPFTMMISSIVIIISNDLEISVVLENTKPFTLTVLMIIAITLISSLLNSNGLIKQYAKFSKYVKGKSITNKPIGDHSIALYTSTFISPFLNMATPVIFGEMLKRRGKGAENTVSVAINIKRGMMVAMLVAPTFAPIALVISSHPLVDWSSTLLYTLPLAALTLLFFTYFKKKIDINGGPSALDSSSSESGLKWIFLYLLILLVLTVEFDLSILKGIILSSYMTITIYILIKYLNKENHRLYFSRINEKCKKTLNNINNEALIFISSGLLLSSLSYVLEKDSIVNEFIASMNGVMVILFTLLLLPLFTLIKLHPIIGFTLFQPMVYANNDITDIQKYMIWVCYWVISLQISPLSVINITVANSFNVSLNEITNRKDLYNMYVLSLIYSLTIILYGVSSS